MKLSILFLTCSVLIFSACALKDKICEQPWSFNGNGPIICLAKLPRWTYNFRNDKCTEFFYNGCGGNDNRFYSFSECEEKCKESATPKYDICELPHSIKGIACKRSFRWSYKADTNKCVQFDYGGCRGNANRFLSKAACESRCKY